MSYVQFHFNSECGAQFLISILWLFATEFCASVLNHSTTTASEKKKTENKKTITFPTLLIINEFRVWIIEIYTVFFFEARF